MSVATKNPFALLDDDEPQVAPVSTPAPAAAAPTPAAAAAKRGRGANGNTGSRRGQYYKRGGATNSGTPNVGPDADGSKTGNPNAEAGGRFQRTEGRGDREGRGRGRGGRGRGGQRFDRHSQTGQVDSEKAIAQGWGAETGAAELKDEAAGASDAKVEAVADESTPAADAPATAAEGEKQGEGRRRREEEEEEDNTLTLEEYLKQKKEKESAVPAKLEGRQVETSDWAGATPLVKDGEEDNYFIGKTKAAPKPRAKKEEKVIIEIEAHFDRPQRDGGRGRGRGRGRGAPRGGRGGDRSSRPAAPAVVDVADESAFPSLGA